MDTEAIKTGIIVTIIGGLLLALILWIIRTTKKAVKKDPKTVPQNHSVFLSRPLAILKDKCLGRNDLLLEAFNTIKGVGPCHYIGNHILITGSEGIGKTLFSKTLFYNYLFNSEIYIGWIECNGAQSIFDIISSTFIDTRFRRKKRKKILDCMASLEKPCILFIDQVDQLTPIPDIHALSMCANTTLVISGGLKKINFIENNIKLKPLDEYCIREILEEKGNVIFEFLQYKERLSIKKIINDYIRGNPFLASAFAKAITHYDNSWERLLRNIKRVEDESDIKKILMQLYKIEHLSYEEKSTLSKLSALSHTKFTSAAFDWMMISKDCAEQLCRTYWLTHEDSVLYSMDETHRDVLNKILKHDTNLQSAIISITNALFKWKSYKDEGFRWLAFYLEEILKEIRGYSTELMNEEFFPVFAYIVADKYHFSIKNEEKCLEWLELCKPKEPMFIYKCEHLRFMTMINLFGKQFSDADIEQAYIDVTSTLEDLEEEKAAMAQLSVNYEYIRFLYLLNKYEQIIDLCKKHFDIFGFDIDLWHTCAMFYHYMNAAFETGDDKILRELVTEKNISCLLEKQNEHITAVWSMRLLSIIYRKWGDEEEADNFLRRYVILVNERRGFYHAELKNSLGLSDEDFSIFMHSHPELVESLEKAIINEDPEALYIEGRYQEKHENLEQAYELYERSARKDSLRGICSLALLNYRGQPAFQDYDKAFKYWSYCMEREHRGSYYWMGILLLDRKFKGYDKQTAIKYLSIASDMGSIRAKKHLEDLTQKIA